MIINPFLILLALYLIYHHRSHLVDLYVTHTIHNSRIENLHLNNFLRTGDNNYSETSNNVISAAETLAIAIQQCRNFTSSSSPNKETIGVINSWLENFMPVSRTSTCFRCLIFTIFIMLLWFINHPSLRGNRSLILNLNSFVAISPTNFNDFIHQ